MNDPERPNDRAVLWRDPALGNIEFLRATFVTHAFGRHSHDEFAIGIIERGTQVFSYRGSARYASAGHVVVLHPGEVHTGQAVTANGYTYRMLYPDPSWVQQAAAELTGGPVPIPFFPDRLIQDPALAGQIATLHASLEVTASCLARDSLLRTGLARLVTFHGEHRSSSDHGAADHPAARTVRAYLDDHYAEDVSLAELAKLTQRSPFHLLRVFRNAVGLPPHAYLDQVRVRHAKRLLAVGLPPHAYLDQVRVRHAKRLLAAGLPIADVATTTGFADQSHLTRRFKRLVGVTPGQYRAGSKYVQDSDRPVS